MFQTTNQSRLLSQAGLKKANLLLDQDEGYAEKKQPKNISKAILKSRMKTKTKGVCRALKQLAT